MLTLAGEYKGPVLEVGPGRVLAGLMKRIDRGVEVRPLSEAEGLEEALAPPGELLS